MRKIHKFLLSGLAALVGMSMPIMSDVTFDENSTSLASTVVGASAAELNSKAPFEFDDMDVGTDEKGRISSLMYELRFRPKEVEETVDVDNARFFDNFKMASAITFHADPAMYMYRFKFIEVNEYDSSQTETLVEYSLFYEENRIYGFAKCDDLSDLDYYRIDGVEYSDWKDAALSEDEIKVLKKSIKKYKYVFDDDFRYYFAIENKEQNVGPFEFEDTTEGEGVTSCRFNNIQLNKNYNVEFTFAYSVMTEDLFGKYYLLPLNCTNKKYIPYEKGYSAALFLKDMSWDEIKSRKEEFSDEIAGNQWYDSVMTYQARLLMKAGIEEISKTDPQYASELEKYLNVSSDDKTVRVFYLKPIEGTPFAIKDSVVLNLQKYDLMTDFESMNVREAFAEYCRNNKDVKFEVFGCEPDYATEYTGFWDKDDEGNLVFYDYVKTDEDIQQGIEDIYMLHYAGGVNVELRSEGGDSAYMTLDLNKTFGEYYYSTSGGGVDGIRENLGVSHYISFIDGSDVGQGLLTNIRNLYGANGTLGNQLESINVHLIHGFWGFSIVPRDYSFLSGTMKIFNDSPFGLSTNLVGYNFEDQRVAWNEYNNLLLAYGYSGWHWFWEHVGVVFSSPRADFAVFYATSTENAVASYSGSTEWGDVNPLWINQMQVMGDLYKGSQLQRNLKIGMTILWFAAVILILVYAVSKFVSLCRVILPRDEELGLGHVTYNWDNSKNENHYDSHAMSFDHSKRKSNVKNENTYGDTHIESSGDKQDYSTRENYIDNEFSSRDTIVNSSGSRTDNSRRRSEVRNENKYGDTTVNSNGPKTDNSRHRSEVRNENKYGNTTVNSNGPKTDNSRRRNEVRNENSYGSTTVNSNGPRTDNSHHRSEVRNENKYGDTTVNSSGSKTDNSYRTSDVRNENQYGNAQYFYRGSNYNEHKNGE